MAKIKDIEPDRMDYIVALAQRITTPPGGIRMQTPSIIDQDHSILHADDAIEKLIDTVWPLEIHTGERAELTFTELMVLMHQIEAMKEQFERAQQIVSKKKMKAAKVEFNIGFRVDEVMTPENVRRLLSLLKIDANQEPSTGGRIQAIVVDPKYKEFTPERFDRVVRLIQDSFGGDGSFTIRPPQVVLDDWSLLEADDAIERLHETEWQLRFKSGREETVEFTDLLVMLHNIVAFQQTRQQKEKKLKAKGVKKAKVRFTTNTNLDELIQPEPVRLLLRGVKLDLTPATDGDEPKLTEMFSQNRMDKCTEVWQRILNAWITKRQFFLRVVADQRVEGATLEDLGKTYLAIGPDDNLTRLPFMDALIVFDMLKQFNTHLQATGKQLERFQIKTEFTQSEAFSLLDDVRRAGIKIGVAE